MPARVLSATELADARADFEHWFSDEGKWPQAVQRSGDGYSLAQAQSSWTTWLMATAVALRRTTTLGATP
jgi:hypothetical protein